MRLLLLFTLLVSTTGCAIKTIMPDEMFTPSKNRITEKTSVTWEIVDNVDQVCKARGVKLAPNVEAAACSFYNRSKCHIVTSNRLNLYVLGHELRHCFEGAWHE